MGAAVLSPRAPLTLTTALFPFYEMTTGQTSDSIIALCPRLGGGDIIILVVSISWLYQCNIIYKDVVKHSIVGQPYVLLALSPCVLIQKYLLVAGLDLGLGVLASFNINV